MIAKGRPGRGGPIVAAMLIALVWTLGTAGPAAAHNSLRSTSPVDKQTVARTPAAVVLTFDEPAIAMGSEVLVRGPDGDARSGSVRLVDNTVRQDLQGGSPAGRYTVDWRVTSADGHPVSGSFTFTSRAASAGMPQPSPTAAPSPDGGQGSSSDAPTVVVIVLAGLVVVGLLVTVLVRRRRR